ncbi:uncharacterized serine-rich protein C215.13 isoform X3 [Zootermopsis nevadensis]|uniref:uncharacterized serine-rich protein C215.13 isoform X3 n=1 Tax=Zootermopsis nevadensis TaxID=136037 RepID=UPI000B8EA5A8|nr:uncharacterized serine-rich protein C215.13 isoform X3 [Zootermopsis nevadensis]
MITLRVMVYVFNPRKLISCMPVIFTMQNARQWYLKMDLYLSTQDTLSLQEMLDCDIKTEIDSVLAGTDLSLSLSELPPLDLDEALGGSGDMTMWFTSNGCLHSGNSNSSNSNFNLDFVGSDAAAMMVNPSSVMPMTLVSVPPTTAFTNIYNSSSSSNLLITTSSSSASSLSPVEEQTFSPSDSSSRAEKTSNFVRTLTTTASSCGSPTQSHQLTSTTVRVTNPTSSSQSSHVSTSNCSGLSSSLIKTVPIISSSTKSSQQKHLAHIQVSNVRTVTLSHHQSNHKRQSHLNNNTKHFAADVDYDERPYPKPAYSYSCLIAMALKNSKTGSLPVSEIYNFMCEHFPYFKTAPNGWKNSVRHNLSLNKCFEKIEKPAGNGSQRKGCLWAMNPAKIAKMDEEVQKWSKKDPMAIRKAMICPENLEMLERGEMKREFSGLSNMSGGCGTSLSGGEDSDDELGGSAPPTPLTPLSASQNVPEFIDINQLNGGGGTDSFDESSLTGFDIEVTKRSRLNGNTIQGNYVYKPMVVASTVSGTSSVVGSRRKTPLLLRASPSASSLIKLDDP